MLYIYSITDPFGSVRPANHDLDLSNLSMSPLEGSRADVTPEFWQRPAPQQLDLSNLSMPPLEGSRADVTPEFGQSPAPQQLDLSNISIPPAGAPPGDFNF